jgi:hypothetical protein
MSALASIVRIPPYKRLLYVLAILAIATTHGSAGSWNDESRMATVQSLVESGSFVIDNTAFVGTGDKVFIDGHFYSDKPPLLAVLGAAVYLPLYHAGFTLHQGWSTAYYLITLLTIRLLWLLGTVALFLSLRFTGLSEEKRFLVALALGVGSLYFSWSTVFNSHEFDAALLSIGFYFLLKARFEDQVKLNIGLAGLCLSIAATADMPDGIFYALFLLYVLRDPRLRVGTVFYLLPLLVTLLPTFAMTYSIHHSIMPVQLVRSYFQYPGSPWNVPVEELSGMQVNSPKFAVSYALLALVGPRGFLLYNPILWVAVWALVQVVTHRKLFRYEAMVIGAGSGALVLYYLLFTSNYGGASYSIRWFVPTLPLLFFFLYHYFEESRQQRTRGVRALLYLSIGIAFIGAVNPWSHAYLSEVPFIANVVELKRDLLPGFSVKEKLLGIRPSAAKAMGLAAPATAATVTTPGVRPDQQELASKNINAAF